MINAYKKTTNIVVATDFKGLCAEHVSGELITTLTIQGHDFRLTEDEATACRKVISAILLDWHA